MMPCKSDYMVPSGKEQKLQLTAQLYCWLQEILQKPVPAWAQKAAADTYGRGADKLVSKLCGEMKRLKGVIPPHSGSLGDIMREGQLKAWWAEHQLADKKRAREARAARKAAKLKAAGLAKLSPDEQRALGLS